MGATRAETGAYVGVGATGAEGVGAGVGVGATEVGVGVGVYVASGTVMVCGRGDGILLFIPK